MYRGEEHVECLLSEEGPGSSREVRDDSLRRGDMPVFALAKLARIHLAEHGPLALCLVMRKRLHCETGDEGGEGVRKSRPR